jgi:1-acyl-sn-glycerol-3-phosphate acyltransferase
MRNILGFVRLCLFAIIGLTSVLFFFILGITDSGHKRVFAAFKWSTVVIRFVLNIKLKVVGEVPHVQGVIMSNHRSYIDIVLIPSAIPYVIVAKRQVKPWPIIGQAAVALKTIFVDRDSAESRSKTRDAIQNRLAQGLSVLIYPEGTTFEGPGVLDFKPGIFRTCAAEGFPVVPIAIEFKNKDMAWIGDDTFLRHFLEAFGHWRVEVSVSVGQPLSGNDGEALRLQCQQWVDSETRRLSVEAAL